MTDTLTPHDSATIPTRRRADSVSAGELFEREGTRVTCSANAPLRLAATDDVWWVASESVDLFLSVIAEDGVLGARRHITRATAGEPFFSLAWESGGKSVVAVATAATELLRISRRRLQELISRAEYADAVSLVVSKWVRTLSVASFGGRIPKNFCEIVAPSTVMASPGDRMMPRIDLLWVRPRGTLEFLGLTTVPAGTLFPLTSRTWLEAKSATELTASHASSWAEASDRWQALTVFEQIALRTIVARNDRELAEETLRLTRKRAADQTASRRSVAHLVSVLNDVEAFPSAGEDAEPLLEACRLVASAAGMTIVPPPPPVESEVAGDPVAIIARASRLRTRRVALRGEWWREEHGPLLGFTEQDRRPLALLPSRGRGYEAVDPASKTRVAVTPELTASLEQFAVALYRPLPEKALDGADVLRFAGFRTASDVRRFLFVGAGGGLLMLFTPIATAVIFNSIIPGADRPGLAQLVVALTVAALTMGAFQVTRDVAVLRMEGKVDSQLQAALWDRVLSLPVAFFRGYSAGDLAQRTMAVNSIRELLSSYVVGALTGGLFSILSFALLFFYDGRLALVASAVVIVAIAVTVANALLQLRYQRPLYALQGALSGLMFQFIVGVAKLRVAGAETRAFAHWSARFAEQKRLSNRARDTAGWVVAANSIFPVLASLAVFAWIGFHAGHLDIGTFTAFYAALGTFLASMLAMSSSLVSVMGVIPIWERATPILRAQPEATAAKPDPGELSGEIEVSHLSFRYAPAGPFILNDVSIRAAAGEFIAVVGPSGSGKSTLLRLLLGFEAAEAGAIYFDQQDLDGIDVRAVRRQIGVVLQSGQLMPGDIYTNIVGASSRTIAEAMEAAEMAGLAEDIQAMPMGVHTVVSEGASTFSGGQRQRLMIARAIVTRPRILLFDEATSALDNRTQEIVSRSLESLKATRIVIAHRLSTIVKADRIYVMDKGRVVQSGSYDELMRQDGLFAELARRQML